jgi:hypothetical protein
MTETTLEQLRQELAEMKAELAKAQKKRTAAEKRALAVQVKAGVRAELKKNVDALMAMERQRAYAEERWREYNKLLKKIDARTQERSFHEAILNQGEQYLIELAPDLCEMAYLPETESSFIRLAKQFQDAGKTIILLMEEGRKNACLNSVEIVRGAAA